MVLILTLTAIMGLVGMNEQAQNAPLTVSVKASSGHAVSSGIAVTVEITNNSDSDFKLNRTTKSPLFTLRLINEQGLDLNKDQFQGFRKDRSNKLAPPLILKPHQTLTYQVRLTNYPGEDGKGKRIGAGKYKISALVPVISYEGAAARVESIESEETTVIVR